MAEGVVDVLETIEIDQDRRDRTACGNKPRNDALGRLDNGATTEQAG